MHCEVPTQVLCKEGKADRGRLVSDEQDFEGSVGGCFPCERSEGELCIDA